ncbi:hypothetical protein BG74_06035 [Sodalis-like endosymbiont of Proechinophthirus fluctus]|uniref:hypothetical protein n=1 Tax=Sodalis-like endosymbiont of Proechinophthirus fluctus TaxID=1462730 RepID=UPI0007A8302A|nr:hypothetical protein [Sodalis-like endosymbiont of Proechinophthirus fluctus]KYP97041.1 hypothetical protein BG74_06035 [Sodalis-like endosymbiont of Proechinophthirus fluctus]
MPDFEKTITTGHLVSFGLTYIMVPIIVLGTFGVLAKITDGDEVSAYVLALFAIFFTAGSYSQMSTAFPVAEFTYTYVYVRNVISENMEFLTGLEYPVRLSVSADGDLANRCGLSLISLCRRHPSSPGCWRLSPSPPLLISLR